jgi:hypothetical protein
MRSSSRSNSNSLLYVSKAKSTKKIKHIKKSVKLDQYKVAQKTTVDNTFDADAQAELNAAIAGETTTTGNSSSSSRSSFSVESSNPFEYYFSSNPFESWSYDGSEEIASRLGLSGPHHTSLYRFTWYGAYLGADIAYALDDCWTLFAELEGHFLDRCNRKRRSWTGVESVDNYHAKEAAYGFNSVVGFTFALPTCWYVTLSADLKWWQSNKKHDKVTWQMAGFNLGVGYSY